MSKIKEIIASCERNVYADQLEVIADEQKIRNSAGKNKPILGYAEKGFFNILDKTEVSGEVWYCVNDNQWIVFNEETIKFLKAEEKQEKPEEPERLELTNINDETDLKEKYQQNIDDLISILDLSLSDIMPKEDSSDTKELPIIGDTIIARGRVFGSFIGTAPMNSLQDEKVIIKEIKDLKNQSPFAINSLDGEFLGWIEEKTIKSIERENE